MELLFVLAVGLVAGTVSGIVGTGASIVLIPILVAQYGPQQAVPIMAIASLMGNVAKVMAWWRETDWRATAVYALTGIPAAALGARTLLVLPAQIVDAVLGAFFILMIPGRRWLAARDFRLRLWHLAVIGAAIGFLTGIVASTGPLNVAAMSAYGLVKGAFIATEAATSIFVFLSKVVTFRYSGALPMEAIVNGLIIGASLMVGAFVARRFVLGMGPETFRRLIDGVMLIAGISLLWMAFR
ncbi:MAG: sulfite exporter TauE/SafE family protein [Alphaproteobacteria bacterium]|nr:sulfite exporter TauE/SafE family protein [Alphaproteobacteria bacterium]MCW5743447.1 sulfite exporter TauE/SafE family protein [Alphaproteobacteria bacterium]